jgi:hypothetical protein
VKPLKTQRLRTSEKEVWATIQRQGGAAGEPQFDSDGKKGRAGLANALGGDRPNHPSEVIATLCGDQGQNC